jgi:hypothetical protein
MFINTSILQFQSQDIRKFMAKKESFLQTEFLFLHIGIPLQNFTLPSSYFIAPINCWSQQYLNSLVSSVSFVAVHIGI